LLVSSKLNGKFDADYGVMSVDDKLDTVKSYVRVTPMLVKCGEMVFRCNCPDGYRNYACEHLGVLSMLWNTNLTFPYVERAEQLKAKEAKKARLRSML
jgi:hypothetical protein